MVSSAPENSNKFPKNQVFLEGKKKIKKKSVEDVGNTWAKGHRPHTSTTERGVSSERGVWGRKEARNKVTLWITLVLCQKANVNSSKQVF